MLSRLVYHTIQAVQKGPGILMSHSAACIYSEDSKERLDETNKAIALYLNARGMPHEHVEYMSIVVNRDLQSRFGSTLRSCRDLTWKPSLTDFFDVVTKAHGTVLPKRTIVWIDLEFPENPDKGLIDSLVDFHQCMLVNDITEMLVASSNSPSFMRLCERKLFWPCQAKLLLKKLQK